MYRKKIRAFDRMVEREGRSVSFLTITQSDKNIGDGKKWITGIMQAMSKRVERSRWQMVDVETKEIVEGGKVELDYVAVLEIQPKRYLKYGVMAAHWHVAIAITMPEALPHAKRLEDGHIKKVRDGKIITWDWLLKNVKQKFGMYFVCDCYSKNVYGYLGKYLAKGDYLADFKLKTGKKAHVFSSSQFPIRYRMSWLQKKDFDAMAADVPEIVELYWRAEGSRIVGRAKRADEVYFEDGRSKYRVGYDRVISLPGEWLLGGLEAEGEGSDIVPSENEPT